jgi:hypothetical protein
MSSSTIYLFANPGQLLQLVVQTVDGYGDRSDGYVPIVDNVVLPDLSNASGYPLSMTRLQTGLYTHSYQLPRGSSSLGCYIFSVFYEEIGDNGDTDFVQETLPITTAGQTLFTLSDIPVSDVSMYVDGVLQQSGVDYTVVGNVVTYSSIPVQTDDVIIFKYFRAVGVENKPNWQTFVVNVARPFGASAVAPF